MSALLTRLQAMRVIYRSYTSLQTIGLVWFSLKDIYSTLNNRYISCKLCFQTIVYSLSEYIEKCMSN